MPKGVTPERIVVCRACGTEFTSTRSGKAAFYCRRPECDEQRRRERIVTPNSVPMPSPRLSLVARIMRDQARRDRDRARFERQWRRAVEPWVRSFLEQRRRDQVRQERAAARQERERERLQAQAARLRPRVQAAVSRALDLSSELAALEQRAAGAATSRASAGSLTSRIDPSDDGLLARYLRQHVDDAAFLTADELGARTGTSSSTVVRFAQRLGFTGYPEMQRAAQNEYRASHGTVVLHDTRPAPPAGSDGDPVELVVVERTPRGDELLDHVAEQLLARREQPELPGRRPIQRAIVRVAHASGLTDTKQALRNLAVEALAWDLALPNSIFATDIDTQAARDAA